VEKDAAAAKREAAALQQELQTLRLRRDTDEAQLNALQRAVGDAKGEAEIAKAEASDARKRLNDKTVALVDLQGKMDVVEERARTAEAQVSTLAPTRDRALRSEAEADALRGQIHSLSECQSRAARLEAKVGEVTAEAERLRAEVQRAEARGGAAEAEARRVGEELNAARDRAARAETRVSEAEVSAQRMEANTRGLQAELDALRGGETETRARLSAQMSRVSEAEDAAARNAAETEALRGRLARAEATAEAARTAESNAQAENVKLRGEVSALGEELSRQRHGTSVSTAEAMAERERAARLESTVADLRGEAEARRRLEGLLANAEEETARQREQIRRMQADSGDVALLRAQAAETARQLRSMEMEAKAERIEAETASARAARAEARLGVAETGEKEARNVVEQLRRELRQRDAKAAGSEALEARVLELQRETDRLSEEARFERERAARAERAGEESSGSDVAALRTQNGELRKDILFLQRVREQLEGELAGLRDQRKLLPTPPRSSASPDSQAEVARRLDLNETEALAQERRARMEAEAALSAEREVHRLHHRAAASHTPPHIPKLPLHQVTGVKPVTPSRTPSARTPRQVVDAEVRDKLRALEAAMAREKMSAAAAREAEAAAKEEAARLTEELSRQRGSQRGRQGI